MRPALMTLLFSAFVLVLVMSYTAGADVIDQTQRFSIAISGGASKGAYEAGLNWGLLKLMRNISAADTALGGKFRPFDAASFAGASAGGINALLSGLVWCSRPEAEGGLVNRIDDNIFRDTWLMPDVNSLLPSRADSPWYLPGDAAFSRRDLTASARALTEKWNTPAFRSGCRVPLGVTVTRILPEGLQIGNIEVANQRFYIPFELRVVQDNSVTFFFNPADYPTLSDPAMILMPRHRNAEQFSIDDALVQEAVLTTSAFPVGFGRKRLQYCGLQKFSQEDVDETISGRAEDDSGSKMLCPNGYELREAEFADGGLFDNLPLGLARTLGELNIRSRENELPVSYVYLDPNRLRYKIPEAPARKSCEGDDPPEACRTMEFSFFTESNMLLGAVGTARKFELYRELTSDNWGLNLSELGYMLARLMTEQGLMVDCRAELPFFGEDIVCVERMQLTGRLLEAAYDRVKTPVIEPFSMERLRNKGVANECLYPGIGEDEQTGETECSIDISRLRRRYAEALISIAQRLKPANTEFIRAVNRSMRSMHNDRVLRVSSRGAPITGTLMGSFGAFLEYKFREYDYYVGVYDAIVLASETFCGLHFSRAPGKREYGECLDVTSKRLFDAIGLNSDDRGRYVFALISRKEFLRHAALRFAYEPMPPEDRDMRIIHDALNRALEAGRRSSRVGQSVFAVEIEFFDHLKEEGFVATSTDDGKEPLLTQIMDDPEQWAYELTRRMTNRLVYLEREAKRIYKAREPDPTFREKANTGLMGASAFTLQTMTYRYPGFTFSPSTTPKEWFWRNIIPYEVSIDFVEGDIIFTWQPTWHVSRSSNVGIRGGLGFAGGLFRSTAAKDRENYLSIGLDYTHLTASSFISSWGVTPEWYHKWTQPEVGNQDTLGGNVHMGFIKDRLRVRLGYRNVDNVTDTWFLTLGVADIPGFVYWLSR